MTELLEGPRTIEYDGYELTVAVKERGGLYDGEGSYTFVEAAADNADHEATGTCGANVFPLRLATWLACRRAVKAAESGPEQSRFDRALDALSDA